MCCNDYRRLLAAWGLDLRIFSHRVNWFAVYLYFKLLDDHKVGSKSFQAKQSQFWGWSWPSMIFFVGQWCMFSDSKGLGESRFDLHTWRCSVCSLCKPFWIVLLFERCLWSLRTSCSLDWVTACSRISWFRLLLLPCFESGLPCVYIRDPCWQQIRLLCHVDPWLGLVV